jgi:hypothetical protein
MQAGRHTCTASQRTRTCPAAALRVVGPGQAKFPGCGWSQKAAADHDAPVEHPEKNDSTSLANSTLYHT